MKHWVGFGVIVSMAVIAVLTVQRGRLTAEVSPAPLLYLVADTEQELMRLPVTLTRISDQQEIAIGDDMARSAASQLRTPDSSEAHEITDYINRVGENVAQHAQRKLPYRFHYIPNDNFINAFALPGGHVFLGKGLLNLMKTEDELANVLGHEVEHIDLRHCVDRVQIEAQTRQLPLGALAQIPVHIFEAGYSKQQELEADRYGTTLAVAAGYSPQGAIQMFQMFQRLQYALEGNRRELEQHGAADLPIDIANVVILRSLQDYFRSHPPTAERIAQIERLTATEHWPKNQTQRPLAPETNSTRPKASAQ